MISFPILVIGGLGHIVAADGASFVWTFTQRLYPLAELQRVAPLLGGAPVFTNHDQGDGRMAFHTGQNVRVGRLTQTCWSDTLAGIVAKLEPTEHWAPRLPNLARQGYGFSVDFETEQVPVAGRPGWWLVDAVTRVYSVDVVKRPAAGGRFLDP